MPILFQALKSFCHYNPLNSSKNFLIPSRKSEVSYLMKLWIPYSGKGAEKGSRDPKFKGKRW
jgi:hypothetical protein